MVTKLIDQGRQRLLTLAQSLQVVDGLLEDELSCDAAAQLLQGLRELRLGRFARIFIQFFGFLGELGFGVGAQLHVYPLVDKCAEELLLLVVTLELVELLDWDSNSYLCLKDG